MSDPTRREFLAVASSVLASAGLNATERNAAQAASQPKREAESKAIPPHRVQIVDGVHAYTDKVNVAAGEIIRFHVSSSYPYELQVCRLGTDVDSPSRDQVLHSFGSSPAAVQAIHTGSYLAVEKALDAKVELSEFAIELWIKRWRTLERQAIVSQFDDADACGFALFVNEDGSLGFYLGDGGVYDEKKLHTTPPDQLKMVINPEGLKSYPDNTPSSVLENKWHHVVAQYDGKTKQVWVDGVKVSEWQHSGPFRPGTAPLRVGASGQNGRASALLDADIAMPALYRKSLTAAEIASRMATQGLKAPTGSELLACWRLDEERGDLVADSSGHGRNARIVNLGTWMIGGPSFNAAVERFGTYDPFKDPKRGHGLRLSSDDLFDCRWDVSHEYRIPATARSGMYVGRIRFQLDGEERLYHTIFIVNKAASRAKAPIALICATNSWKAYSATSFSPSWKGLKKSIGNNGFANSEGDPPAYCFYRPHRAGQGTYQLGFRMPWPVVGPYVLMGPEEWDYSHLSRQDRFTQVWLETKGYSYDVLTDAELHLDPNLLDGYQAVFVVGHSEYWSFEAMNAMGRYLDRGGNAVVLSGNTAFWRVSFNEDATVMECRKCDAPGSAIPAERRGELWHSHDGQRGGMSRECGFPVWRLFGLEYFSLEGVGWPGVGPYVVRNPDHFLFKGPKPLNLKAGDTFGGTPGKPFPQPIGHEGDVRVSTMAKYLVEAAPPGGTQPTEDPAGMTLLADGYADPKKIAFAWDYFQRLVMPDKLPPLTAAAEMILWDRPGGGNVFHSGSINSGSTLASDPSWSNLMHNVLSHFGCQPEQRA
ncbi:N,N-dimethylformamidase beta subunit family domain-containing protein [Schlesneria sp. DSM 10557]|uniref:N,N-dimethylformamidase beta subunit family domain-containing protein n=1 Tax=Schlesneria sp. DSM 10557 TaxID=3044399 RepID=UPI00359F3F08